MLPTPSHGSLYILHELKIERVAIKTKKISIFFMFFLQKYIFVFYKNNNRR